MFSLININVKMTCLFMNQNAMLSLLLLTLFILLGDNTEALYCLGDGRDSATSCTPNCGSSAASGSWVPTNDVITSGENETIVWKGSSSLSPPKTFTQTFTQDLLYSEGLPTDLSDLIAKTRCTRDEDMPWKCRIMAGRWKYPYRTTGRSKYP